MGGSFVDRRTNNSQRAAADRSRRTGYSLLHQPGPGVEIQALPRNQVPDLRVAQWPKPYVRNLRAEYDRYVPVRADAIVYRVGDDTGGCALAKPGLPKPLASRMSVPPWPVTLTNEILSMISIPPVPGELHNFLITHGLLTLRCSNHFPSNAGRRRWLPVTRSDDARLRLRYGRDPRIPAGGA